MRTRRAPVGRLTRLSLPLALMALVALVSELVALGGATLERTAVTMLIDLVVVVGLYMFVGISGVFSFGHISFMAIGAYAAAILSIPVGTKSVIFLSMAGPLRRAHVPPLAAVFAGGAVAAVFALVASLPLARLSGLVAALGTFALLLIVNVVASAWTAVTNGTTGMSAIPTVTTLSRTLLFALGAIALGFAYGQSRRGRRLRASREDEAAARAIGVDVGLERGVAFVASAFVVGVAGGLYAQYLGSIDPGAFFLQITFLTIAMLVVGGLTSLSGAVVGTILISALAELLRRLENGFVVASVHVHTPTGLQDVALGLLMLVILILRPRGVTNGRELRRPGLRRRSTSD